MTLRQALGGDARRLHELVEQLLDSEDVVLVLSDGRRAVNFVHGFALSPCQLELMAVEIERLLRSAGATGPSTAAGRRIGVLCFDWRHRLMRRVQADGGYHDAAAKTATVTP